MSYVQDGVEHVMSSDQATAWAYAHIACCPRCAAQFGAASNPVGVLPFAQTVAEAQELLDGGHEAVVLVKPARALDPLIDGYQWTGTREFTEAEMEYVKKGLVGGFSITRPHETADTEIPEG